MATPPLVRSDLCVYPNPVRADGVIEWTNGNNSSQYLKLCDPLGRLLLSRSLGIRGVGNQLIQWRDVLEEQQPPPGVYFLDLRGPDARQRRARVIVTR